MKLAVLFRGPIRPTYEACKENIDTFLNELRDNGNDVTTFCVTWNKVNLDSTPISDIKKMIDEMDHAIACPEPHPDFYLPMVPANSRRTLHINAYKVFWQGKIGTQYIKDTNIPFDYVIVTRFDVQIKLGETHDAWFTPDHYVMQEKYFRENGNDQFGIGTVENCVKAWKYGAVESLREFYTNADTVEHCLFRIAEANGVKTRPQNSEFYELDPRRHITRLEQPKEYEK